MSATDSGFVFRLERTSSSFCRALTLTGRLDLTAVTATFANGVLEIRVPKPVRAAPHRVQLAVGGGTPRTIEGETTEPQAA